MPSLEVSKAERGDIYYVAEIEEKIFKDEAYHLSLLMYLHRYCGDFFIVARINGHVVGYAIACPEDRGRLHLYSIAVREEYRERGIGKKLLRTIIEKARKTGFREIYLEVRVDNLPAIKLYEKMGFKRKGLLEKYYSDGTDAYIYVLEMASSS